MANINSINSKSEPLASTAITIDSASGDDSYVQFNINTTNEFRLGVDATDDDFKIANGGALGTTDYFIMDGSGQLRLPYNPAFSAYLSATQSNVTGSSSYTIPFNTELYDIGSNFNTSTGIFTAPVDGKYMLSTSVNYKIDVTGGTQVANRIFTSNRNYDSFFLPSSNRSVGYYGVSSQVDIIMTIIADMDASDTAYILFTSDGGSDVDDIIGGSAGASFFMGYLLN